MKRPFGRLKSDAGAALLLALWALFLLSAMVIAWALNINSRLAVSSNANRVLEAEAMASSGADVALSREISPSSPNLHRQMGAGESYDVQITGECGRLNLNFLTQGEDPNKLRILRQYLNLKGVDLNDLDVMMDSLLDWVSPTKGLQHLNACPESDVYHPAHAPLTAVDELKEIRLGRRFYRCWHLWCHRSRLCLARRVTRFGDTRRFCRSLPATAPGSGWNRWNSRRRPDGSTNGVCYAWPQHRAAAANWTSKPSRLQKSQRCLPHPKRGKIRQRYALCGDGSAKTSTRSWSSSSIQLEGALISSPGCHLFL